MSNQRTSYPFDNGLRFSPLTQDDIIFEGLDGFKSHVQTLKTQITRKIRFEHLINDN